MKKILFIDRDGTLIKEPSDFQVDSFEKLEFVPGVFTFLGKIAKEFEFELVMVTNQDGLGSSSFPEDTFWPVQNFIIKALAAEGIIFSEICIDKTFENEKAVTRKPNTGMLTKYLKGNYDLVNSYVIGDRPTDIELANNLGSKSIFIKNNNFPLPKNSVTAPCSSWQDIYEFLKLPERKFSYTRKTNETAVDIILNLDGNGASSILTGISFFDHMLEQIAKHAGIDLVITAKGDLHVDEHHTIEDVGIALGETFLLALGNKMGLERYGFCLPMDDCLAQVALDLGGRSWLVWNADFKREKIGEMPTEMFFHFFKSFSDGAKCNLNIKAEGKNEHHKIEAIFKAFAKSIKPAIKRNLNNMNLPSTKGTL